MTFGLQQDICDSIALVSFTQRWLGVNCRRASPDILGTSAADSWLHVNLVGRARVLCCNKEL